MAVYTALTLLAILFGALYLFYKKTYSYWERKGVKGPLPLPVLGNFGNFILQKVTFGQCLKDIYFKCRRERLVGLYRGFQPIILVRDPELVKYVLIKDFSNFQDRGLSRNTTRLGDNLFATEGEKWKIMRQKLTPVFTSKKLKDMAPIIQQCADSFMKYVDHIVRDNIDHEIRALTGKYTLEVIGSCAFGLDLNTLTDEINQFSVMANKVFKPSLFLRMVFVLETLIPGIRKLIDKNTELQDFFLNLIREVIKKRGNKPSSRNDFMDLMIELREQGRVSRKLEDGTSEIEIDDYMIAAQAFVFYAAGFETSSATMSFLIHELALNPDIQDRVYKDICEATEKHNGQINYESIKDMKYLEKAFDETLRKYPAASILFRKSVSAYKFPGTNVTIAKGTPVLISVSGLSKDTDYFPNPEKFDPENFSRENLEKIPQCVYLPFGDGPRNCIGMRFAKVQSMVGIASFLKKFKVEPSHKTKRELEYDIKSVVLTALGGIWVKISHR